MVNESHVSAFGRAPRRGALLIELMVAVSVLAAAMTILAANFYGERKLCRNYYYQAIAMQIVDGEMEILAAGAWRAYQPGTHAYRVTAAAARNLPPGRFVLTLTASRLRLEWLPQSGGKGIYVVREVKFR